MIIRAIKVIILLMLTFNTICCATSNDVCSNSNVTLIGDKIYLDSKLYAELIFFDENKGYYRGIGIKYLFNNSQEWIYPKDGWQLRHHKTGQLYENMIDVVEKYPKNKKDFSLLIGGKYPSKGDIACTWCYAVIISNDGRFINYKTGGILFDSHHKYFIK